MPKLHFSYLSRRFLLNRRGNPVADERLPRKNRIRGKKEYHDHFCHVHKEKTPALTFFIRPRPAPEMRLGLSVSRKVGGAVQRNQVKRRLREIFRKWKATRQESTKQCRAGIDLVIHPNASATRCTYRELEQQFLEAIENYIKRRELL